MRAVWRRRKWLAIVAFCAPFSAIISLVIAMPDFYRASATVLVGPEQAQDAGARSSGAGELEPRLQTISQEILSRSRLQELIARFDLYPTLRKHAAPEVVIERMRRDIRFERKEAEQRWGRSATVAFTLSYQGWEPRTVAEVTNTLASFYVDENEKLRARQAAGAQTTGAVDRLTQLKRELAELRTHFSDKYPDVVRLKAEIAALEREEAARTRAGTSVSTEPDLRVMTQQIDALDKQERRLQTELAAASPRGEDAIKREQGMERLRRDYTAVQEDRASLSRRYERARRAATLERDASGQFRILDPAMVPNEPIAPSRARLVLMGLMLSLGLAGVAVLLAEQIDTSFHRLDELWAFTNMPILASVPRIVTRADAWRSRLRVSVAGVATVAGLATLVRLSYSLGQASEQLVWMLAQRGN